MSWSLLLVLGSVALDILANVSLELSRGFRRKGWGVLAIVAIMAAFALLGFAVKGMDLFVAYAIWGALSISGTALATWWLFQHRLNRVSCSGLALLVISIALMQYANSQALV
ncbi:SMR family transporter [Bacterioplanoides pacificum]|uniref:Spermidine export protein MdtI n=1 Tax=Bacterioplanoides pacificum TaxID=1171596 RepID=A0ABV7VTT4_9GAMM